MRARPHHAHPEFRDCRQGGADLRPQFRVPGVAASRADDLASLRGHAGGMGAKPGRRSADRSGEIAEKRPEITQSAQILAGSDFLAEAGLSGSDLPESDLAGPDLPSQIDF